MNNFVTVRLSRCRVRDGIAGKARRTPDSEEQRHGIRIVFNNNSRLFKQYIQSDAWRECMYKCGVSTVCMYSVGRARV